MSDNILAGLEGLFEGISAVTVPYFQNQQKAKLEDTLAQNSFNREQQGRTQLAQAKFAQDKQLLDYQSNLDINKENQKITSESNATVPVPTNLKFIYGQDRINKNFVNPITSLEKAKNAPQSYGQIRNEMFKKTRITKLGEVTDPSKGGGALEVSKKLFDRAERVQSLGLAKPDGNLDKRNITELARALDNMLAGSNSGAVETVRSLVPQSAVGDVNKLKEWLYNMPEGLGQQEFVKSLMGSVKREKETAAAQIKRTQFQRIAEFPDVEIDNPEYFEATVRSNGVDLDEYKKWVDNGYKDISAVQMPDQIGKTQSDDGFIDIGGVKVRKVK